MCFDAFLVLLLVIGWRMTWNWSAERLLKLTALLLVLTCLVTAARFVLLWNDLHAGHGHKPELPQQKLQSQILKSNGQGVTIACAAFFHLRKIRGEDFLFPKCAFDEAVPVVRSILDAYFPNVGVQFPFQRLKSMSWLRGRCMMPSSYAESQALNVIDHRSLLKNHTSERLPRCHSTHFP